MEGENFEEYLGDGVYASFDGYQIWLDTRAQHPVNRIALEPSVYRRLQEYVGFLERKAQESSEDTSGADHG